MSIVIDSNVWISALVFGGRPRRVFERCVQEGVQIVLSAELMTETRRILGEKFVEFLQDYEDLLVVLQNNIVVIKLGERTITASRDPDDNLVLETAVAGAAHFVVSGDNDLLVLRDFESIRIITPAQFMEQK